jgi:hypothetical protein
MNITEQYDPKTMGNNVYKYYKPVLICQNMGTLTSRTKCKIQRNVVYEVSEKYCGKNNKQQTINEMFIGVIIQNRLIRINGEMIMVWAQTEQDLRQATELNF